MTDPKPHDPPPDDVNARPAQGGGAQEDPNDTPLEEKQGRLDRFRGTGVGVEDPNLVGDAGPYDVAPGDDPKTAPES